MNNRLEQLSDWMEDKQHDFAFVSSTANVFYLTNFHCTPHERLLGLAVFPKEEPILICPGMETQQARKAGWNHEIIGYGDAEDPWALISQSLNKRGITRANSVAIEKSQLTYQRAEKLHSIFPCSKFAEAEEKLEELRMIKDESELKALREAARLADVAVQTGVDAIKEGTTEMEILAEVEYEMKKKGISEMAFSTMVLTGANAASPHGSPGNTPVRKGDLVLFDLGVVVDGYCSDITRTVAYDHVSHEQEKIYNTVLDAQKASLAKGKPGARIGDLDQTARQIISEAGYGEYFPHRIGHGLGMEAHEAPSMSENNNDVLKSGMVYTIEPGIYVPDVAGVRIEDDVYVTEKGYECLTQYPKELQIVK
ncbi:MAG TPA: Xaa-Pro peptidase family protein [Bacillales bacterium]|nr:Xaa-Pro peptidase family protein [Bacillales bacterium]